MFTIKVLYGTTVKSRLSTFKHILDFKWYEECISLLRGIYFFKSNFLRKTFLANMFGNCEIVRNKLKTAKYISISECNKYFYSNE